MVFSKWIALGYGFSCIIWKDGIFSQKQDIFSLEVRDDLFQEIHRNLIFSVCTYGCYKRGATLLCQKKSKMIISRKNTSKGD